uniref:Chalcone/stilbene synthase N-terminal domain-containing protein n=1 Tax=Oryza nivara TaxID=4536 RepID=A0A0E0J883_ORYNI
MPGAATTAVVGSRRGTQHAEGPATIIAIGTANPANIVPQDEFADYYFGLTKSEHLTELKDKMKRIFNTVDPSFYIVRSMYVKRKCQVRTQLSLLCSHEHRSTRLSTPLFFLLSIYSSKIIYIKTQ